MRKCPRLGVDWSRMLIELRREAGFSQRSLGMKTGINRSTIRRIENGAATGDLPTIELILDVLGYELDVVVKTAPKPKDRRNVQAQSERPAVH